MYGDDVRRRILLEGNRFSLHNIAFFLKKPKKKDTPFGVPFRYSVESYSAGVTYCSSAL